MDLFNNYFLNVTTELGIINDFSYISESTHIIDPVNRAIAKYVNHPSIILIKEGIKIDQEFNFNLIEQRVTSIEIDKLVTLKTSPKGNIPIKIFKYYAPYYNGNHKYL